MARTVAGLFDSAEDAQDCIRALVDAGISREDLSIAARDRGTMRDSGVSGVTGTHESVHEGTGIGTNTAAGALFGGLGGLLIGLGALAIPGLGPIVAAGPIATTLAGAGFGAAGGAIIGSLKEAGIPDEDAHVYAEGVRRGGTLLLARTDDALTDRVRDIMDDYGAVDIEERGATYRQSGWNNFDEKAEPYGEFTSASRYDRTAGTRRRNVRIYDHPNR